VDFSLGPWPSEGPGFAEYAKGSIYLCFSLRNSPSHQGEEARRRDSRIFGFFRHSSFLDPPFQSVFPEHRSGPNPGSKPIQTDPLAPSVPPFFKLLPVLHSPLVHAPPPNPTGALGCPGHQLHAGPGGVRTAAVLLLLRARGEGGARSQVRSHQGPHRQRPHFSSTQLCSERSCSSLHAPRRPLISHRPENHVMFPKLTPSQQSIVQCVSHPPVPCFLQRPTLAG